MNFQPEFYKEKSLLSIEKLVEWKRNSNSYNFQSLPKTAIIDGFGNSQSFLSRFSNRKIKGIKGTHFLSKNKNYLLSSNFVNGASDFIGVCEELRCLGVENFIFIGVGGMVSGALKEGNYYHIEKAISGVGTTTYYSEKSEFSQQNSDWSKQLLEEIEAKSISSFSTDAPFRETQSLINELINKDIQLIEMECAALFAFSEFHSVNSVCFLFGADRISLAWNPPKNFKKIVKSKQELINKLIRL